MRELWVEAGQPIHTFGEQTQRSYAIVLTSAAKREISLAWKIAALTASASIGKLPKLDELLSPDTDAQQRTGNAKLLHALRSLKERGVPMRIERVERLH